MNTSQIVKTFTKVPANIWKLKTLLRWTGNIWSTISLITNTLESTMKYKGSLQRIFVGEHHSPSWGRMNEGGTDRVVIPFYLPFLQYYGWGGTNWILPAVQLSSSGPKHQDQHNRQYSKQFADSCSSQCKSCSSTPYHITNKYRKSPWIAYQPFHLRRIQSITLIQYHLLFPARLRGLGKYFYKYNSLLK